MHNCRKVESQLVELLFDDIDADGKRRLLTEIEACTDCLGQYQSLSETLLVFERTAEAGLPPESYWPGYNATLRTRLHAPVPALSEEKASSAFFWRRLLTAKFQVPVPVAAALIVGLIISSALALSRAQTRQTNLMPSGPPVESVRLVEVPFAQEKIVTRTVYVERKREGERVPRSPLPAIARAVEVNDSTVARSKPEEETGFFTRANLKGFQPMDEIRIRVLKRNNANDK